MTMIIRVDQIHDKALTLQIEEPIASFPVLAGLQADGICSFSGPVQGSVTTKREYDHLRVAGTISTPVVLACSRCLVSYETAVESAFTIIFRKGSPSQGLAEEDEIELDEQDLISATYSGDEIDLTHEIEEQITMEIPFKPLCGEECKGLCPSCGMDLNRSTCSCGGNEINFKFSALKNFKASR
jgi:uncharacterized protein